MQELPYYDDDHLDSAADSYKVFSKSAQPEKEQFIQSILLLILNI